MFSGDQSQDVPQIDPLVYARQGRRWVGRVPVAAFGRLTTLATFEDVAIELAFEIDDHDRIRMLGGGKTKARIVCQRCLEEVDVAVESSVDVRVMNSDQRAQEIARDYDTMVIAERTLSVAELIEDDLILSLPEWGCEPSDECQNRPAMDFPDSSVRAEDDSDTEDSNPFAVLASLKNELSSK